MRRFDPGAAVALGAVDTVLGGVFLVFLVPFLLEGVVEEFGNVFRVDWLFRVAAFRGHQLWVGQRGGEESA